MTTAEAYSNVLTALAVWREGRGECQEARRGILHVIMRRAEQKYFGRDVVSVILFPHQFSAFSAKDPNAHLLPNPVDALDWKAWLECCDLVDAPGDDPTGGALLYESIPNAADRPSWAVAPKMTCEIDHIRFYRK